MLEEAMKANPKAAAIAAKQIDQVRQKRISDSGVETLKQKDLSKKAKAIVEDDEEINEGGTGAQELEGDEDEKEEDEEKDDEEEKDGEEEEKEEGDEKEEDDEGEDKEDEDGEGKEEDEDKEEGDDGPEEEEE